MLDLYEPEEEEMLELLVPVLFDEDIAPSDQGLHALTLALDAKFGAERLAEADVDAAVVPLRRGLTRIVTGVAAAVVVLALVLAWYGWHEAPGPASSRTRLEDATAALRTDLRNGSPQTRLERDVTSLAGAIATVPTSERTDLTAAPKQLITSACQWLEGSATASQTPSTSLPEACRQEQPPQTPDTSTSSAGAASGADATTQAAVTPDQGAENPWPGSHERSPSTNPSGVGLPPEGTTQTSDGRDSPASDQPDQYGTSPPTTSTSTSSTTSTTTSTTSTTSTTQATTGWPSDASGSSSPSAADQSPAPGSEAMPSSQSPAGTDPDSAHQLPSYSTNWLSTERAVPTTPCQENACGADRSASSFKAPQSGSSSGSAHSQPRGPALQ